MFNVVDKNLCRQNCQVNTIVGNTQPIKSADISFGNFFEEDSFSPKEINYERLATLISQKVPMEKMDKFYSEMINSDYDSFMGKITTFKTKLGLSMKRKLDPETVNQCITGGLAQAIGMLIPEPLKVDRNDEFYDIPYVTNMSIINIMNAVDNYDDLYDALDSYTYAMEKCNYNKDSDLPTVVGVDNSGKFVKLEYDKELTVQYL